MRYATDKHRKHELEEMDLYQAAAYMAFMPIESFSKPWKSSEDAASLFSAVLWIALGLFAVCMQFFIFAGIAYSTGAPFCTSMIKCEGSRVCVPKFSTLEFWGSSSNYSVNDDLGTMQCKHCNMLDTRLLLSKYLPDANQTAECHRDMWTRPVYVTSICPLDPNFTCPENDDVCDKCYDPDTNAFSTYSSASEQQARLAGMEWLDWTAWIGTSLVIGGALSKYLRESIIGECARKEYLKLALERGDGRQWWYWTVDTCLEFVFLTRRVGIPAITMFTAAVMVIQRGTDALSISMDAVAILFVLEIDNVCFRALPATTHALLNAGRLRPNNDIEILLSRMTTPTTFFVPFVISIDAFIWAYLAKGQTSYGTLLSTIWIDLPWVVLELRGRMSNEYRSIIPNGGRHVASFFRMTLVLVVWNVVLATL